MTAQKKSVGRPGNGILSDPDNCSDPAGHEDKNELSWATRRRRRRRPSFRTLLFAGCRAPQYVLVWPEAVRQCRFILAPSRGHSL